MQPGMYADSHTQRFIRRRRLGRLLTPLGARLGQDNYDDYLSAHLGEGRAIRIGVPFSVYPQHYKRDSAGKVYSGGNMPGSVYFDDSVPWEVTLTITRTLTLSPYSYP